MKRRGAHDRADLEYMRSLSAAVVQRSPRHLMSVLLMLGLCLAAAIAWMSYAYVDVVVRGNGKVVPRQQLQVIQSLEGGVIADILVEEGALVEIGQPLVKISDIAFASSFEENRLLHLELRARISRLLAQADGTPFESDPLVAAEAPALDSSARRLFETNKQQHDQTQRILAEQVRQHESELIEARARQGQLRRTLSLVNEEITLKTPLVKKGLVTRVEFLQLQKQQNETRGELESVRLSVPRVESTIEESKRKSNQSLLDFRNQARRELNETTAEASRIAEAQSALQDRVRRTTMRSPVRGTITRLHFNTVGGVLPPGGAIMEIVPYEDSLLIQVQIKPKDIASINVGQLARLKFTAYDFAIHGSIDGDVVFLSADTTPDENGEMFYTTRIEPQREFFGHHTSPLPIRVGMTVEADIITDKKSVLQYILKPINRGLHRALREG